MTLHTSTTKAFLILLTIPLIQSLVEFDNSIPNQPDIVCSNGELTLKVNTEKGAPSHVFVKGHFRKEGCSYSNSSNATFEFAKCDVGRQREVSPKGMAYTMTVVVQLHPLFTTKVDRAYRVRCFYKETEKAVGAEYSVSDPTPTLLSEESEQPTCLYTIHKGSPNGPLAKFAQVGDVLYHVWECPSQTYEMYVHDCFVVDGENSNNKKVIDTQGCSEDVYIFPHIIYNENRTKAFVNSNAFNFPDQNSVRFNCQIQICVALNGDCYVPRCGGAPSSSVDDRIEPLGNDLARDELITTPLPTTTSETESSTAASTTIRSTTTTVTTLPTTSTPSSTTTTVTTTTLAPTSITLPTDFPTPDPVFRLLKNAKKNITNSVEDEEGSGIEIMNMITPPQAEAQKASTASSSDESRTTKREIRRRDAVDVDISSPELMIVDKDFAADLPSPLEQQSLVSHQDDNNTIKSVCLPFFLVWVLAGIVLFAVSLTFTALFYSLKHNPRFQVLP